MTPCLIFSRFALSRTRSKMQRRLGFLSILSGLLLIQCHGASEISVSTSQMAALRGFFDATKMNSRQSRPMHNWFLPKQDALTEYCNFTGVSCDLEGYVIAIELDEIELAGSLPNSMGEFPKLQKLSVLRNRIGGQIPSDLAFLPELEFLNLGRNELTGSLPGFSGMFPNLQRFLVHYNRFEGTFPSNFCDLGNLKAIDVSGNVPLVGTVPECFGHMTELEVFRIRDAGFVGDIPLGLCQVRNMNGLLPNTFGCDGVACGPGFFQPFEGRQTSETLTCVPCATSSNVIGASVCTVVDTTSPSQQPSLPPTSLPPTTSIAPSESFSTTPSGSPSQIPSGTLSPTKGPTQEPSIQITHSPTLHASDPPTVPTLVIDTVYPSQEPSSVKSINPTIRSEIDLVSLNPTMKVMRSTESPSMSPTAGIVADKFIDDDHSSGELATKSRRNITVTLCFFLGILCLAIAILAVFYYRQRSDESRSASTRNTGDSGRRRVAPSSNDQFALDMVEDESAIAMVDEVDDVNGPGIDVRPTRSFSNESYASANYALSDWSFYPSDTTNLSGEERVKTEDMTLDQSSLKKSKAATKIPPERPATESGMVHEGDVQSQSPHNPWLSKDEESSSGSKKSGESQMGIYSNLFHRSLCGLQLTPCASQDISVDTGKTPILSNTTCVEENRLVLSETSSSDTISVSEFDNMTPAGRVAPMAVFIAAEKL